MVVFDEFQDKCLCLSIGFYCLIGECLWLEEKSLNVLVNGKVLVGLEELKIVVVDYDVVDLWIRIQLFDIEVVVYDYMAYLVFVCDLYLFVFKVKVSIEANGV